MKPKGSVKNQHGLTFQGQARRLNAQSILQFLLESLQDSLSAELSSAPLKKLGGQ